MENKYYIYFYLRDDNTPYYIGKGCNHRAYVKHNSISIPKDKTKIIIVESNLLELGAFMLERYYIKQYGRKDNGTGILRNLSDGGDGCSGYKHTDAHKEYISKCLTGRKFTEKHCQNISMSKQGIAPKCTATRSHYMGEKNPNYGKKCKDDVKAFLHDKFSKLYNIESVVFTGLSEVMEHYSLNSKACVHYRIKSTSYQFKDWNYVNAS